MAHPTEEDQTPPKSLRQRAVWLAIFCFVGLSVLASIIMALRMMSL
ncbi:hypothetical protein [Falsirhodobacter xinxiangensis]|nr:hypothetical protein [Rhodobacter xinxiangensis]